MPRADTTLFITARLAGLRDRKQSAMAAVEERGAAHQLNEPSLSHTPYSLVDPAQHERLAARGRLCRTALLVSSVMVIGSLLP